MLLKNITGQGVYLFAYDTLNNVAKTGDSANITGSYALDGTNTNGFTTANPTEMGGGVYWQPLATAETNANAIAFRWASATAGIQIAPVLVFTTGVSIPVVAPGATNGMFIAGTNAATVITTSLTTHFIGTVDTVTTVTNQLTAAAIATAFWTDTTGSDFTTTSSPGKILVAQLGGAFTTTASSVFSTASLANAPVTAAGPTASAIATAVWQDATAGDFTASSSIGKSLYTGGVVPGGTDGLFIAGTNAATTITTSLTTHLVGTVDTVTTVGILTTYTGNTPQTGDSFARIGATGSSLTSLAPSSTALSTATWTSGRASNLDFLDVSVLTRSTYAGGAVASVTAAVTIDTTQAIALSNTANTLGDCLNAARAQGFGKWAIVGTTLTLYANDGTTSVRVFTLDSSTAPTSRV